MVKFQMFFLFDAFTFHSPKEQETLQGPVDSVWGVVTSLSSEGQKNPALSSVPVAASTNN